jgi:DNA-binding transcriptional LysR family regulator
MNDMRDVHLRSIDLNLLTGLGALLQHRGVSRAARDVGLSQPAMSRALDRLRHLFGDDLLVRTGAGMVLTARAEALAPRIAALLAEIRDVVSEPEFDPRLERRTFRIAATDSQTTLLFPGVMARLLVQAPLVDLHAVPFSPDIGRRIQSGEVEMTFSLANYPLPPGARSAALFEDRMALVMRRGNPAAARNRLSLADYAALDHVTISIFGDGRTETDAALAAAGLDRRIAHTTPHFIGALMAVAATDMVAMLSRAFARQYAGLLDLVLIEPPFANIALPITLVWGAARDNDRLLAWLRQVFLDVAATVRLD